MRESIYFYTFVAILSVTDAKIFARVMIIDSFIIEGISNIGHLRLDVGEMNALIAPNEHGSLELPAIIVCSAAGMQLGMGWFFPGKLTRMKALLHSSQEALVMVLAMMPFFMVAGFIESFVTRHQEWPLALRTALVVSGLLFSIYYIILLPRQIARKMKNENERNSGHIWPE